MKKTKRIFASLLVLILMAAMLAAPASAAKITINNAASGHTYEAYQIFDGTLDGEILSNIVWGSGIATSFYDNDSASANYQKVTNGSSAYVGMTASEVAKTLTEEAHAKAFAKEIAAYLGSPTQSVNTQTGSAYVLDGLDPGYYLIKDMDSSQNGNNDSYTRYIVQILGDITIDPKSGVPTLTKGVSRAADSRLDNYKEAVSASVGDTVYYALTASMHSNINDYDDCFYQIIDTMPASLTFNKDTDFLGVYVINGSLQNMVDSSCYEVEYVGNTLTVTFKDVHEAIYDATSVATAIEDKLVVAYKATLNNNVILGVDANSDGLLDGQHNTAVLKYSNNPNENYVATNGAPISLGQTAEASAYVYSYILQLYKIDAVKEDGNDVPLKDAEFTLHIMENGITPKYLTFDANGLFTGYAANESGATKLKTGADGMLTVKGLSSGTYHFEETEAPAGYNSLNKEIKVQFTGVLNQATGDFENFTASQDGGSTITADKQTGTAKVTVLNHKGSTLPATGGMGTTIFYIAGAVLMIGAAAVLFTKKRSTQK